MAGVRVLSLLCVLVAVPGCTLLRWAPGVPSPDGQAPVAFADEAELLDFLEDSASALRQRVADHGTLLGPGDDWYREYESTRQPSILSPATAPEVERAQDVLEVGGVAWVARKRGLVRVASRDGALVVAPAVPMPEDTSYFESLGLLGLGGDVLVAVLRNRCGGFTLARYARAGGPADREGMLRVCGRLIGKPWVARVRGEVLAYASFDVLGGDKDPVVLPTAETPPQAARSLHQLGPVYYPLKRDSRVLLRTLLRCDAAFTSCSAHSWVSPRVRSEALWLDAGRFALTFSSSDHSALLVVPLAAGRPLHARLPKGVFALGGLSDGRLALLRGELPWGRPWGSKPFFVELLDAQGRTTPGPVLSQTGWEGGWTWAFHGDWLVYGSARSRLSRIDEEGAPRVFVARLPGGPVEVQPLTSTMDAVRFIAEEAVLLGVDDKGGKRVMRRPLTRPGPWRDSLHDDGAWKGRSEYDLAASTLSLRLGERRLLVVPYPDMTWTAEYRLRVLELTPEGVTVLGHIDTAFPREQDRRTGDEIDDRVAATAWGDRLLLRLSRELVLLEPDGTGLRELSRLKL